MTGVNTPGYANRNRFGLPSQGMSAAGANTQYMNAIGGGIGGGSSNPMSVGIAANARARKESERGNRTPLAGRGGVGVAGRATGGTGGGGGGGGNIQSTSSIGVKGIYSPSQLQGMQNTAKNQAIQQAANSARQALAGAGSRLGAGSATNMALKNQSTLAGLLAGQRGAQDALMRGTEANAGHELQREGLRSNENIQMWGLADNAKNREAQLEIARQNQQLQTLGMFLNAMGGLV